MTATDAARVRPMPILSPYERQAALDQALERRVATAVTCYTNGARRIAERFDHNEEEGDRWRERRARLREDLTREHATVMAALDYFDAEGEDAIAASNQPEPEAAP